MIPFFRKIRKKLADDNKPMKYMRYAIGEILLVVIGILIALSINNWNEERKNRQAENEALINLKLEFDENEQRLEYLLDIKRGQEKSFRAYLEIITDDSISMSKKIIAERPHAFAGTWGASNTVLSSLINTGGIDRIQNDSLRFLLTSWPILVNKYKEVEARFTKKTYELREYEDKIVLRSFVKEGNYRGEWPGNYYPESMVKKRDSKKELLLGDFQYYNHLAGYIDALYINLILGTQLTDNYEKISILIIRELKDRKHELLIK